MRRKLVKQGKGALTISLPSRWLKENTLEQGDELIVDEKDQELVLTKEGKTRVQKTTINLEKMTPEGYRSILGGLYRGGYDEIEISVYNKNSIADIEDAANSIYGLEVFYTQENRCIVKTIYDDENTDIRLHIDRMVYTIKTMQEIILKDLLDNKKESLDELYRLRSNVLKQRDLIVRVIRKKRLLSNDIFPYYTISLSLWGVARNYYHLCKEIDGQPDISILENTNIYFNESFKYMKKQSMKDHLKRHDRYSKIYKMCKEDIGKNPIATYCMSIILEIQLSDSSIFLLNHG